MYFRISLKIIIYNRLSLIFHLLHCLHLLKDSGLELPQYMQTRKFKAKVVSYFFPWLFVVRTCPTLVCLPCCCNGAELRR